MGALVYFTHFHYLPESGHVFRGLRQDVVEGLWAATRSVYRRHPIESE